MKIEEYQALAMRTSPEGRDRVLNGCLGLIGESGEIVDVVKKWKFQSGENAELPKDKLIDECGDVLWYCAEVCEGLEINMARAFREKLELCPGGADMDCDDLPYWVFKISGFCGQIYGAYYWASGRFQRPEISSYRPAPIAYPAKINAVGIDAWRFFDTITWNIADILMLVQSFLRKFADSSLEEAMERNIEKLKKRYPNGFDPERSLHRPEYKIVGQEIDEYANPSGFLFEMRNRTI